MRNRIARPFASLVLFAIGISFMASPAMAQSGFRYTPSPWEGFYVGGHAGYGWGSVDTEESTANPLPYNGAGNAWSHDTEGSLAGVHAGLNWESYSLLMGIEASYGYMTVAGDAPDPASPGLDTVALQGGGYYADMTGRVGFAPEKMLYYMKAGVVFADLDWSVADSCTAGSCSASVIDAGNSDIRSGWTAGLGVAYAVTAHTSLRLEYAYYDFGNIPMTGTIGADSYTWNQTVALHTATAGVSVMF